MSVSNYKMPHVTKVLPEVYDDALSYYEVLGNVLAKLNEIIDYVDNIEANFLAEANAYTDTQVATLSSEFTTFKTDVNKLIAGLDTKYNDFVAVVNARMTIAENKINAFSEELASYIKVANEYTNQAILDNNAYIINETTKALDTVTVVNYFTGERTSIQDMFNYLAQFHLDNSITYTELANRDKTYDELIAYNMSYTDLALNGGAIIV